MSTKERRQARASSVLQQSGLAAPDADRIGDKIVEALDELPPRPPSPQEGREQDKAIQAAGRISVALGLGGMPPWSGKDFAGRMVEILGPIEAAVKLASPTPISMAESSAQTTAEKLAAGLHLALDVPSRPPAPRPLGFAERVVEWLLPLEGVIKNRAKNDNECRQRLAEVEAELAATLSAMNSSNNLQKVFTAQAESREAMALYNYAGTKLQHAKLVEQILSAVSRGHLSSDFFNKLNEWSK